MLSSRFEFVRSFLGKGGLEQIQTGSERFLSLFSSSSYQVKHPIKLQNSIPQAASHPKQHPLKNENLSANSAQSENTLNYTSIEQQTQQRTRPIKLCRLLSLVVRQEEEMEKEEEENLLRRKLQKELRVQPKDMDGRNKRSKQTRNNHSWIG